MKTTQFSRTIWKLFASGAWCGLVGCASWFPTPVTPPPLTSQGAGVVFVTANQAQSIRLSRECVPVGPLLTQPDENSLRNAGGVAGANLVQRIFGSFKNGVLQSVSGRFWKCPPAKLAALVRDTASTVDKRQ
jgi:hypothetical protein